MVLDTHAIARASTAAELAPAQVDAITDAIRQAAEHEATDSGTLATKADLSALEANLLKWTFGIVLSVAGIQTAILMAALRFLG
jgi:hypothetical protein